MKILAKDIAGEMHSSADSAVVTRSQPWFVPDEGTPWSGEMYIAAVVSRLGKGVATKFARRYYDRICVVVHPCPAEASTCSEWTRDGAILASDHITLDTLGDTATLAVDDETYTIDIAAKFVELDALLGDITACHTIKTGDMLLLPLPVAAIALERPLTREISLDGKRIMKLKVR